MTDDAMVLGNGERRVLATLGIVDPDLSPGSLHSRLLAAVRRVGPGASLGSYLSAVRFTIVQEHLSAGRSFAESKALYEKAVARRIVEEMHREREGGPKMSLGLATAIAEGDDALFEKKLTYVVAEKREQTMRKWLDAIEGALDNHRTDRADLRAADRASAQGLTGPGA